jgi:hypothetical protein
MTMPANRNTLLAGILLFSWSCKEQSHKSPSTSSSKSVLGPGTTAIDSAEIPLDQLTYRDTLPDLNRGGVLQIVFLDHRGQLLRLPRVEIGTRERSIGFSPYGCDSLNLGFADAATIAGDPDYMRYLQPEKTYHFHYQYPRNGKFYNGEATATTPPIAAGKQHQRLIVRFPIPKIMPEGVKEDLSLTIVDGVFMDERYYPIFNEIWYEHDGRIRLLKIDRNGESARFVLPTLEGSLILINRNDSVVGYVPEVKECHLGQVPLHKAAERKYYLFNAPQAPASLIEFIDAQTSHPVAFVRVKTQGKTMDAMLPKGTYAIRTFAADGTEISKKPYKIASFGEVPTPDLSY